MAKQTVSTSTDRWQQGQPPRGGSILPLPTHNQTSVISSSGIVSGPSLATTSSHIHPTYQVSQRQQQQTQHQRKKSGGGAAALGVSGGGQPGRDAGMERGRTGAQALQHSSQGTSDTANILVHQHDLETLDCSRNPLLCLICNNIYDDPRLLNCYHSFCAKCLPGRLGDSRIVCPLCG
jgi:hypothetical protein